MKERRWKRRRGEKGEEEEREEALNCYYKVHSANLMTCIDMFGGFQCGHLCEYYSFVNTSNWARGEGLTPTGRCAVRKVTVEVSDRSSCPRS